MRHAFTIAHGTTTVQHNLLVELRQDGVTGYGEGASSHAYAEFTADSMRTVIEAARPQIEREHLDDPAALWDRLFPVLGHNRFALCALDEAAHDLWGKLRGAPVWKLWGLHLDRLPLSNYTIGIDPIEKPVTAPALSCVNVTGAASSIRLSAVNLNSPVGVNLVG